MAVAITGDLVDPPEDAAVATITVAPCAARRLLRIDWQLETVTASRAK